MHLLIDDRIEDLEHPTVQQVMNRIQTSIHSGRFYSYLIADGETVYSNEETYLKEHLTNINELKVVTQTVDEMIRDSLGTACDYLNRAIPLITQLADRFYQNPGQEDWKVFSDLLAGIEWLDETLILISKVEKSEDILRTFHDLRVSIQNQVKNMNEALKASDSVLTADILQYEVQPLFVRLEKEMQHATENEGNQL